MTTLVTYLTNALAAEQDKNKILAEQKAVLVKAIQYYFSVLEEVNGKSWNNNPDHVLSEMLKAIKQAN